MKILPYKNRALGVDERARDLLGRMTLEEKAAQMLMFDLALFMKKQGELGGIFKKKLGGMGIGCLQEPRTFEPGQRIKALNYVQRYLLERTRLGIPAIIVGECLHGHMAKRATIFPQAIALASTWNPKLVGQAAKIAALEARATGLVQAFAPDLDLARDPRWGRVEETYGEDPYLVARMGVAYIKSMQGKGPLIDRKHLVCTAKHFAVHGSPEAGVNLAPVAAGLREIRTVYLPPFEAAVKEAGVLAIMPAYSELDGIPASASKWLLTEVLRNEWGFRGYVFSDYCAISMLANFHRTAHSAAEAGAQAIKAGMDLEAPAEYAFGKELLKLVRNGKVSVALINQAVERIVRIKFITGLFENPYADAAVAARVINCPEHRRAARKIAEESIILLKNQDRILPLAKNLDSIAVIGPNADAPRYGDYSWLKTDGITPLQAIRAAVSRKTKVFYAVGCGVHETSRKDIPEAVETARRSKVAVVIVGDNSGLTGGVGWGGEEGIAATCGEGYDRTELTLPGVQGELVKAVFATGTPVVLVLIHGRPVAEPWIYENVPAVVDAWYLGEQGGFALADVLFGKVNPSGRLPVSIPQSVGHVPACYNSKPSARGYYHNPGSPEKPGQDYVFSSPAPLFEFGHGLGYSQFKYSKLRVSPRKISFKSPVEVAVNVANIGRRDGKEVVQLYLRDKISSVTTPVKSLVGFEKISLRSGKNKTVRFKLMPSALALFDENMQWRVEAGEFEIFVGGLKETFAVTSGGVLSSGDDDSKDNEG